MCNRPTEEAGLLKEGGRAKALADKIKINMNIQDKTITESLLPFPTTENVNYFPLISDFTQIYTSVVNELKEIKMLTVALAVTRIILCRQGHFFCLTSESTTIIKSSFGCNSSNKHFMSLLFLNPIQCLWCPRLCILMTSEMPLLWRCLHAYNYWLNFTLK